MRADNSHHLAAAARQRTERTRAKALRALRDLEGAGQPVTYEAVANKAGVSRSWLYSQPGIRATIDQLRTRNLPSPTAKTPPQRQRASEDSLLRRLEATTARIRQLEQDNRHLRQALAQALGAARARRVTGEPSRRDTPEKHATRIIGPC